MGIPKILKSLTRNDSSGAIGYPITPNRKKICKRPTAQSHSQDTEQSQRLGSLGNVPIHQEAFHLGLGRRSGFDRQKGRVPSYELNRKESKDPEIKTL